MKLEMSFLSRLADRLILCPSTHPIDPEGKRREVVTSGPGKVECWVGAYPQAATEFDLVVIKFPGTGGRAERARIHPAEVWPDLRTEVWTVNQKGYGGSDGPASIQNFVDTSLSVFDHVVNARKGVHVVAMGNSLGCISALHLAARRDVVGIMLRNPPALQQMICTRPRYAAWNFGLSRWIAAQVPDELDSVANAARCTAPCLFVQSELDRVVPVEYQNQIIAAYSASKRVFSIAGADHHELVTEHQQEEYLDALKWLRVQLNV